MNPEASVNDMSSLSEETIQLINNTRTNPLISVSFSNKQYGEGIPDSTLLHLLQVTQTTTVRIIALF